MKSNTPPRDSCGRRSAGKCQMKTGAAIEYRRRSATRFLSAGLLLVLLCVRLPAAELGEGIQYWAISKPAVPLSMHVLEIRRGQPDLWLTVSVGARLKGNKTVPEMVAALSPEQGVSLAAVNGDYFEHKTEPRYFGTLEGLCIIDGELVAGPAGRAFCIDWDGQPQIRQVKARFQVTWPTGKSTPFGLNCSPVDYKSEVKTAEVVLFTPRFGRSTGTTNVRELVLVPVGKGPWLPLKTWQTYSASVSAVSSAGDTAIPTNGMVLSISKKADAEIPTVRPGDILRLSTAFDEDLSKIVAAIGGGPPLLENGRILPKPVVPAQRAPRTAVGLNATNIFLVVVDGRQANLSIGMDIRELAEFMHELGCTTALNLDGGGSSTFWLAGRVVNSPSDGKLRPVGNCLILLRRPAHGY